MNIRAAVLHNVSDALASVAVIVVGVVVMLWNFTAADVLATLVIAGYMLWQSFGMLRQAIAILMNSAPLELDTHEVVAAMQNVAQVCDVHHVHLWQLDEHQVSLEAHIVIASSDAQEMERIKDGIKQLLREKFAIAHSTLEFELAGQALCQHPGSLLADH